MNKISINIILIFCLISCTNFSFHIGEYEVSPIGEFGDGCYISCKLGCKYDAFIENIKSIQWDKRHIIIEQYNDKISNWYMIIAGDNELKCCNNDTVLSFSSKAELDSLIKVKNINVLKMNKKQF